jgi:hypothetical protein
MVRHLELTDAEFEEVKSCLIVERENVGESLNHYPKGGRDHKSYAKAAKLLDSVISKMKGYE